MTSSIPDEPDFSIGRMGDDCEAEHGRWLGLPFLLDETVGLRAKFYLGRYFGIRQGSI